MACKDLGLPLYIKDFDMNIPKGNTYEITIGPHDHIVVTVQHSERPKIKTKTLISPIGIHHGPEDDPFSQSRGEIVYKTDFSFKRVKE